MVGRIARTTPPPPPPGHLIRIQGQLFLHQNFTIRGWLPLNRRWLTIYNLRNKIRPSFTDYTRFISVMVFYYISSNIVLLLCSLLLSPMSKDSQTLYQWFRDLFLNFIGCTNFVGVVRVAGYTKLWDIAVYLLI